MTTINEIVSAAAKLDVAQFLKLRQQLDRLEKKAWEAEHVAVTARMKRAGITDEEIDRRVMRRRCESRS